MTSILPPNATPVERAFEAAIAALADLPVPVATLWDPARCPATHLPWLAWALSVDDWDPQWSESQRREVIEASVEVHRRKGTRGAIRRALAAAGYGDAVVTEAWEMPRLGDAPPLGQSWRLGWPGTHWADYWVEIRAAIFRRDADALAALLASVAPVRCRLRRITLAAGARHILGRDVWALGNHVTLGGVYQYEVN